MRIRLLILGMLLSVLVWAQPTTTDIQSTDLVSNGPTTINGNFHNVVNWLTKSNIAGLGLAAKYWGSGPPVSIVGNLPGDLYFDTTNNIEYFCAAAAGTAAPACSSVSAGNWTVTTIPIQVNGVAAGSQTLLNLAAGTNMTLTDNGSGTITFASSGSGGATSTSQLTDFTVAYNAGNLVVSCTGQCNVWLPGHGPTSFAGIFPITISGTGGTGSGTFYFGVDPTTGALRGGHNVTSFVVSGSNFTAVNGGVTSFDTLSSAAPGPVAELFTWPIISGAFAASGGVDVRPFLRSASQITAGTGTAVSYSQGVYTISNTASGGSGTFFGCNNGQVGTGTATGYSGNAICTNNSTPGVREFVVPVGCTAQNLYVRINSALSASGSYVFTLYDDGASPNNTLGSSTGLTVTFPASSAQWTIKNDLVDQYAVTAGHYLVMQTINNATVSGPNFDWGFICK